MKLSNFFSMMNSRRIMEVLGAEKRLGFSTNFVLHHDEVRIELKKTCDKVRTSSEIFSAFH